MIHNFQNTFAAIDFELTGLQPGWSEPCQIGVVIFDAELKPTGDTFMSFIQPEHMDRVEDAAIDIHHIERSGMIHAPVVSDVSDQLLDWRDSLGLGMGARLIPIAHNWDCEHATLHTFFGTPFTDELFHFHARDTMRVAAFIRDTMSLAGLANPFPDGLGLKSLCSVCDVKNSCEHDALADAMACGAVYSKLCQLSI